MSDVAEEPKKPVADVPQSQADWKARIASTPGKDLLKLVQRHTLQFANDGQIERQEFISSVTYGEPESNDFEFEGKTYRVRSIPVSKTTGSIDRLR